MIFFLESYNFSLAAHIAKVGVVIPIWNVAPYIERCAESLMNQTLDDIQFVFVDDASPDNSIDILNEVLRRHPERLGQVTVVRNQVNKGLPTARKTGLIHINAEYVAHCDSDDWVEPTMYEKMYLSATSHDADIVICDFYENEKVFSHKQKNKEGKYLIPYLHRKISPYVWNRITRKDIYRLVDFPMYNYYEDWVQNVQTHAYCNVVSFVKEPLYHYRKDNPQSLTRSLTIENCDEILRQCMVNINLVENFVKSNNLASEKDLVYMKVQGRSHIYHPKLLRRHGRRQFLRTYPEVNSVILWNRWVPLYFKLEYIAILLNLYPAWERARKLYNKFVDRVCK